MILTVFVSLTVALGLTAALLHFTELTSDPKWEWWCGKAMIMTLIPVLVIIIVTKGGLDVNPYLVIGVIWAVVISLYVAYRINQAMQEKAELHKTGAWKCRKCGSYNPNVSLVCWKCSTPVKPE